MTPQELVDTVVAEHTDEALVVDTDAALLDLAARALSTAASESGASDEYGSLPKPEPYKPVMGGVATTPGARPPYDRNAYEPVQPTDKPMPAILAALEGMVEMVKRGWIPHDDVDEAGVKAWDTAHHSATRPSLEAVSAIVSRCVYCKGSADICRKGEGVEYGARDCLLGRLRDLVAPPDSASDPK